MALKREMVVLTEDYIKEIAGVLLQIDYQIADLTRVKEELENKLVNAIGHKEEGQKMYVYGKYKITVKTGVNYTLDKEEYEVLGGRLPIEINPVTLVTKYELNKKIIRDGYLYGCVDDIKILDTILKKKPSKLSVVIGAAV